MRFWIHGEHSNGIHKPLAVLLPNLPGSNDPYSNAKRRSSGFLNDNPSEVRAQLSSCNFGDFPTRGTQFIVNFLTPEFGPSYWSFYEPVTGLHIYLNRAWACHFIFTSSSCGPISLALWNTMEITCTRRTRATFACENCSKCHTKVVSIFFQLCYIKG